MMLAFVAGDNIIRRRVLVGRPVPIQGEVKMTRIKAATAALSILALIVLASLVGVGGILSATAVSTTVTSSAVADTYLSTVAPGSNYGGATVLPVSGTQYHVLLRFNVSIPSGGAIIAANLRVYSKRAVNGSVVVHPGETSWDEAAVSYATRPLWHPEELARTAALRSNKYATAALPASAVPASGSVGFELTMAPDVQASLSSRETSNPPQLVITFSTATPSPTATPTSSPSPTATPTVTATTSPSPTSTPTASPSPTGTSTPSSPAGVLPSVETVGFSGSGDVSDDSAIWVNDQAPNNSAVIADNKASSGGGIGVFGMDGKLIQYRNDGMIGNVDLRTGFSLGGRSAVLVGANNRTNNTLVLYTLDTAARTLSPVAARSIATVSPNYGFCMYHSSLSGKFYGFVTPYSSGIAQEFELKDNGAGLVDAVLVRTIAIASTTESCVADDELGYVYFGEEDVAIWKYGAEPGAGESRVAVDAAGGGHLVADIEGMSIEYGSSGAGHLFVSSQGDSTICAYERAGSNAFVKKFSVAANGTIDAVTGTDGVDVTSKSAGTLFPRGVLVVHDDVNTDGTTSNLKFVPLDHVFP